MLGGGRAGKGVKKKGSLIPGSKHSRSLFMLSAAFLGNHQTSLDLNFSCIFFSKIILILKLFPNYHIPTRLPSLAAKHAKANSFKWLYIEWQKREMYVSHNLRKHDQQCLDLSLAVFTKLGFEANLPVSPYPPDKIQYYSVK